MTNETEQAVRTAFTAGAPNTISDATAATFREQMLSRGIPSDEVEATLARNGYGPQQSGSQQTTERPSVQPDVDAATKTRALSSAELETAADTLRKFWTGSPEELEAALARAGAPKVTDPSADKRNDQEREYDASSLGAPADAAEYDLGGIFVGRDDVESDEAPALAGSIRTALGELGVPRALGQTTATDFLDAIVDQEALAEMDEVAKQQYILEQRTLIAKVLKVPYPEVIAALKPFMDKLSPATREWLGKTGAVNKATSLIRLYQTATLRNERARMSGKS